MSPMLGSPCLPVVLCLATAPHKIFFFPFSMNTGIILVRFYLGNHAPEVPWVNFTCYFQEKLPQAGLPGPLASRIYLSSLP